MNLEAISSIEDLEYSIGSMEITTEKALTMKDIKWFNSSNPSLKINETEYNIFTNTTVNYLTYL